MTRHIELSVPPAESNPLKQKPTQSRKVLQLWASPLSGRQPSDKKFYLQSLLIRVSAWCDARLESAFKNTSRESAACSLISICVTHTSLFKDGLSFGRVPTSTELLRMIDSDWEEVKWLQQPPLSSQQVLTLCSSFSDSNIKYSLILTLFSKWAMWSVSAAASPLETDTQFLIKEWKVLHRWSFSVIVNHVAILKSVKWITTWFILTYFALKGSRKESVAGNKT